MDLGISGLSISGQSSGASSFNGSSNSQVKVPVRRKSSSSSQVSIPRRSSSSRNSHESKTRESKNEEPVVTRRNSSRSKSKAIVLDPAYAEDESLDIHAVDQADCMDFPKAVKMRRAKAWDEQVEEQYRLQLAGWKDIYEYLENYEQPDRWPSNENIKCLRVKDNGFYTYFRQYRECDDKYLNRVKMYEYECRKK